MHTNFRMRFAPPKCVGLAATLLAALLLASPLAAANGACNALTTVGGGTLGTSVAPVPLILPASPPTASAGAGWDVGGGQCNGDFTVVTDPSFPGGELELGMRIEQRRVGPVNFPDHSGVNYLVQTGVDPGTANRAWWNFQHSIAYNGDINALDGLTFVIRTDVGPFVPTSPAFDMLALRGVIDARNNAGGTVTYSDLYQTSQNPVFSWFTPVYDLLSTAPGAWMLTLAAVEAGKFSSVSICAHTTGEVCAPPPGRLYVQRF